MKDSINVVYLLALVIGTFGFVSLLRYTQKNILAELEDVLYRHGNVKQYLQMLRSRKLGLVLRKGTLLLLELNAYLYTEDNCGAQGVFKKLDTVYLTKGERLDYYQKKLSFSITTGRHKQARETYQSLELLLIKEADNKLKAILVDARLLLKIYVDRDTTLIPELQSIEQVQNGSMRGITRYRLAKLHWYTNNKQKALEYLASAESDLKGTHWEPIVKQARENPNILEVR